MAKVSKKTGFPHVSRYFSAFLLMAFFGFVIAVAHFANIRQFGLYEDDYAFVGECMDASWGELPSYVVATFRSWPQGRPIGFSLPKVCTVIGMHLGGLPVVYLIAFGIATTNALLFFLLVRRVSTEPLAIFSTLVFCLFPADAAKPLLTHGLILQPSMSFFLAAAHLFVHGRRMLSYIAITGSLLTFETPVLPFLLLPLLRYGASRSRSRVWIIHFAVLFALLTVVWCIRQSLGEEKVNHLVIGDAWRALSGAALGPAAASTSFAYGPLMALREIAHADYHVTFVVVLCTIIVAAYVYRRQRPFASTATQSTTWRLGHPTSGTAFRIEMPSALAPAFRNFLAGAVMLPCAYLFCFTDYPPLELVGRTASKNHLAASFGAALAFGAIFYSVWFVLSQIARRSIATIVVAAYFGLLAGYGYVIQQDYVRSWDRQRWFWTAVLEECPDLEDGTMIFVEKPGLRQTQYIQTNSWADPLILAQLLQFPQQWQRPPMLFVVKETWESTIHYEDGSYRWKVPTATWWSYWTELPEGNVIVLRVVDGRLARATDPIAVSDRALMPKKIVARPGTPPKTRPLYDYLIRCSHGTETASAR